MSKSILSNVSYLSLSNKLLSLKALSNGLQAEIKVCFRKKHNSTETPTFHSNISQ